MEIHLGRLRASERYERLEAPAIQKQDPQNGGRSFRREELEELQKRIRGFAVLRQIRQGQVRAHSLLARSGDDAQVGMSNDASFTDFTIGFSA